MRRFQRTVFSGLLSILGSAVLVTAVAASDARDVEATAHVVVRAEAGQAPAARRAVERLGGDIGRDLRIIDGFAATVPVRALPALRTHPGVVAVTRDAKLRLASTGSYDVNGDKGSTLNVATLTRAVDSWKAGFTGKGIDVALIDSGVVPVQGLTSGNVIPGPDLSFESQVAELRHLDTFGHGTHMASIIAGRDRSGTATEYASGTMFTGIAPDARLISIKVAAASGATDVSQVIAAIDWVVQNRNKNGLNIRVLNLSFGTDSTQSYLLDPLAYAAEVAMRNGIVVVAAVGNDGNANKTMANPAYTPGIVAVNAVDTAGTATLNDDTIPLWATKGNNERGADVAAPGVSVIGLRAPGSFIDEQHPAGRVGERFFRGSGSSQATAVVSGLAALLVQRYPSADTFQLKDALMKTAQSYSTIALSSSYVGKGLADVRAAQQYKLGKVKAPEMGTGTGLLEVARGSIHVVHDGVALVGEQDIFGKPWVGATWAPAALSGSTWTSSGTWNGSTWTGSTWTSDAWFGKAWQGSTWTGSTWTGSTWTGSTWTGSTWTGSTWTGSTWTGSTWTGSTWTGSTWTSGFWAGSAWS